LVTGQLAERVVYESASQQSHVQFSIKVLSSPVAALLTPQFIAEKLRGEDLGRYDCVIVPGMVRESTSIIEDIIKLPVFKGTKYASDIPVLFEALGHVELSKVDAADAILSEHIQRRSMGLLEQAEHLDESVFEKQWNMIIGGGDGNRLLVGRDFPMRVVAEILDGPLLSDDELEKKARYYVKCGARIIDIGMLAGKPRPDDVKRIVTLLKRRLGVPISVDALCPEDLEAGLKFGADMILSLNSQNIDRIRYPRHLSDVAVVVIPDPAISGKTISLEESVRKRIESLEENVESVSQIGFSKIIADPILDPLIFPGTVPSIIVTHEFSKRYPHVPLMFGLGNITELIDADSIGVNATLAGIAQELNASLLLTTEGSTKTTGAVSELATACKMMYLAKRRISSPKDLGIDLLRLKEKRRRDVLHDGSSEEKEGIQVIEARRGQEPNTDPRGFFKINVDQDSDEIVVSHFNQEAEELDFVVRGSEPLEIRDTLIRLGVVSTLEHAFYLGVEIEKAKITSWINRSYYQDEEVF